MHMSQLDEPTALSICQSTWPNATITPVAGSPNMLGWWLFIVAPSNSLDMLRVYITNYGEPLIMHALVLDEPLQ